MITFWKPKTLKITYNLDEAARVAWVYINKKQSDLSESEAQQVESLVEHFRQNLNVTVMVEEK